MIVRGERDRVCVIVYNGHEMQENRMKETETQRDRETGRDRETVRDRETGRDRETV